MRNVVILGSGRSGTSLAAGLLASAGYHLGSELYAARRANAKGFYESPEINLLNERVIVRGQADGPTSLAWLRRDRSWDFRRWLLELPVDAPTPTTWTDRRRLRHLVRRAPYCYKDPRFCYTLPAWEPFVGDALRVCVFRHPSATIESILREVAEADYLRGLTVTAEHAERVWSAMYRHVLDRHRNAGDWLFLDMDQLVTGEAYPRLEEATGTRVDRGFADPGLRRTASVVTEHQLSADTVALHEQLRSLAGAA